MRQARVGPHHHEHVVAIADVQTLAHRRGQGLRPREHPVVHGDLAAGTVSPPRLLLLDEPVSALDPGNRELALALIESLTARGVAMLSVFHDLDAIARLATRVLALDGGRIAADGPPSEILRVIAAASPAPTTEVDA